MQSFRDVKERRAKFMIAKWLAEKSCYYSHALFMGKAFNKENYFHWNVGFMVVTCCKVEIKNTKTGFGGRSGGCHEKSSKGNSFP